jgi:hypothetical protein
MLSTLRVALVAFAAMLAASVSALADSGTVRISFVKAGGVIGGSVGGLSYGFTFGASQTDLHGRVSNIFQASDIEGVYGAGGAGAAVVRGAQAIVLTNQRGAVLQLSGSQTGLMVNLDLSGMAVSLR